MPVYVLDSNFFIQAHRINYPIDIATGFWNKVKQLAEEGKIISIDKVRDELFDKNDALEAWCKNNLPKHFFKNTSVVIQEYTRVTAWAYSRAGHYQPNALNEFLQSDEADAFLVAYCLADPVNRILVTQEISESGRKNKIKIPEACLALDVSYVNTLQMFRNLKETF